MEFVNYEQQYKKAFDLYVHDIDKRALSVVYNSATVDVYQHDMDNGFVSTSYGETIHKLRTRGCQILGTAKAPWAHRGDDIAIIYEDVDTYERYWCHINERILNWWLEQAAKS